MITTRLVRLLAVSLVAACGGGATTAAGTTPATITNSVDGSLASTVPTVDGGDVLAVVPAAAELHGRSGAMKGVPVLVVIDARGTYRVATPPATWQQLGAFRPESTKPYSERWVAGAVRDGATMERDPRDIVAGMAGIAEGTEPTEATFDDPPPPPPEDDADADESGGTGTAMALDEGKMGKPDSERAEGQYKMKRSSDDPQLRAREEEQEERWRSNAAHGFYRGPLVPSTSATRVGRVAVRSGFSEAGVEVSAGPELVGAIAAEPSAKAAAVVDLIGDGGGNAILVAHGKDVRPLRVLFGGLEGKRPERTTWIEARAERGGFVLEGVGTGGKAGAAIPVGQVGAAWVALAANRQLGKDAPVDVLVDDALTAQGLVDVIVALDRAGARAIAVGRVPAAGSPQASLR